MTTIRPRLALGGLLICGAIGLQAQSLSPEMTVKVDKIFEKWNRPTSPGCALGIYQNGQIVYRHGYGMANLNDDVPITPVTVFHVASISKQFTAAAIILLAQRVQTVDPTSTQLAEYGGSYVSEEIDPVYRFEARSGKLTLLRLKNKPDPLRPTTRDVFIGRLGTIRFTRDTSQRVTGFVLDAGRIQGLTFIKRGGL